jgi:hypothetical protein
VSCRACGECYLTARTLEKLERIHRKRRKLVAKRLIPVASFGGAA